ncbi:TetR/AcrR family transcriptional regulator [Nocardioides sp.]|uniref:TetR/AcrR family transcriptional regulator n=1 Tax=Nocardioides sp. TaxID=35761 RepID=UPI002B8B54C0|nr:TetR/AcrR family transcriptional regulator [Nocardioides sp.]HSX68035.1 TetR/AcrR family transcriptional regulator [Nocardioides sp.]
MTPTDRNAVRRRALLDAGIGLLGSEEAGAVNVRAACRSTGVTERYFYEIFGTRDDYVRAVYDDVSDQARAALLEAAAVGGDFHDLARRAVDAFVALMIDRPDMGRVLLLAPYREPAIAELGLGHLPDFFAIVDASFPEGLDSRQRRLTSVALVGALTSLFTQFLGRTLPVGRDALVDYCVDLIVDAAERTSRTIAGA